MRLGDFGVQLALASLKDLRQELEQHVPNVV